MAVYAWRINRPGHIRDVEIELGRQLGLQVTLEGYVIPGPARSFIEGIVLRQEEPRRKGLIEIARAALVRLVRSDRELTLHAEGLKLRGESPKQTLAQVGALDPAVGSDSVRRDSSYGRDLRGRPRPEGLHYQVQDVAGEFLADPSRPTLRVAYRLAEPGGGTRCELTLQRDRLADPVRHRARAQDPRRASAACAGASTSSSTRRNGWDRADHRRHALPGSGRGR